jgi:glyoxylase-like metal-dependent hydrolase (beta-lactamase superfamily II)
MPALDPLADGLWRWTARHPEWHPPTEFGREVASYALRDGADTILIDPLVPSLDDALLAELDAIVTGRLRILITIPYHVRSAEQLARRYAGGGHAPGIWGHPAVAKRLADPGLLHPIAPESPPPGGIRAFAIGSPRRQELPLYLPARRALAFGDAIVSADGGLRVWIQSPLTDKRLRWYRERFLPTLQPLRTLDVAEVLVAHGQPVLRDGGRALARALDSDPWYHRPS